MTPTTRLPLVERLREQARNECENIGYDHNLSVEYEAAALIEKQSEVIAALVADMNYISKQWPDSSAAKTARASALLATKTLGERE